MGGIEAMKIGVIGLGSMGLGMACSLAGAGFATKGYDIKPDAVRKLSGVVGITNAIMIQPKVAAIDVRDRIEQALSRNAVLEVNNIRVEVAGGHVKLWGKVNAWHDRTLAERAAWAVPGVNEVDDHLTIG